MNKSSFLISKYEKKIDPIRDFESLSSYPVSRTGKKGSDSPSRYFYVSVIEESYATVSEIVIPKEVRKPIREREIKITTYDSAKIEPTRDLKSPHRKRVESRACN